MVSKVLIPHGIVKETFSQGQGFKFQLVKTFLLIGVLFLAGGMFYYFAQAIISSEKVMYGANFSEIGNIITSKPKVISLGMSYPDSVGVNESYTLSFTIRSLSQTVIHNATIKLTGLKLFGAKSDFKIERGTLIVGNILPDETTGHIQLNAPMYPIVLNGVLILETPEAETVTKEVRINVVSHVLRGAGVEDTPYFNTGRNRTPPQNNTFTSLS